MSVEVFLRDTPDSQIPDSPLIAEASESTPALKELFREAWDSPEHEQVVSSQQLEERLPGAIMHITKELGQSEMSTDVQARVEPYREFVSIVKEREDQGMQPTAIVRFAGEPTPH